MLYNEPLMVIIYLFVLLFLLLTPVVVASALIAVRGSDGSCRVGYCTVQYIWCVETTLKDEQNEFPRLSWETRVSLSSFQLSFSHTPHNLFTQQSDQSPLSSPSKDALVQRVGLTDLYL